MASPITPLSLPERLTAARRLAVGFSTEAVARAASRTVDLIDGLTRDPAFIQLVSGWDDILSLPARARTQRLIKLAHAALETALLGAPRTAASTALALLELDRRKTDPVVHLANGLSRIAERELARLLKATAAGGGAKPAAQSPGDPSPGDPPPAGPPPGHPPPDAAPASGAAPGEPPRREPPQRPAKAADRFASRVDAVAARLRGRIVAEHGWSVPPVGRDTLNLSPLAAGPAAGGPGVAGEDAAQPAAAPPAPPPAEAAMAAPPETVTPATPPTDEAPAAAAPETIEAMVRAELAELPPATQAVLARFSPDDWSRLFLQLMAQDDPATPPAPAGRTGPGTGGGWPEGP